MFSTISLPKCTSNNIIIILSLDGGTSVMYFLRYQFELFRCSVGVELTTLILIRTALCQNHSEIR